MELLVIRSLYLYKEPFDNNNNKKKTKVILSEVAININDYRKTELSFT